MKRKNVQVWSGRFAALLLLSLAVLVFSGCPQPSDDDPSASRQPPGDPALTGTIAITGLARVGETLLADTFELAGEGELAYQWLRDDAGIAGEAGASYALGEADAGALIKVRVSRAGYSGAVDSEAAGPVASVSALTGIEEIAEFLAPSNLGYDVEHPVSLPLAIQLSDANWNALLDAVEAQDKFVALDLSACTAGELNKTGTTYYGGLNADGTFYAHYEASNTAEVEKVVKVILPEMATGNITKTSAPLPNGEGFVQFKNLAEIHAENIINVAGFSYMPELTTISFPNAETLEVSSCYKSPKLTTLIIPKVHTIKRWALRGTGIRSLDLSNVTSLHSEGVLVCENLTSIRIPAQTVINMAASPNDSLFGGCTNLTDITIAPSHPTFSAANGMVLSKDGQTLYAWPSAPEDATIPAGIIKIATWAFMNSRLKTINLSDVEELEVRAIRNNTALTRIIGPRVRVLGDSALSGNSVLEEAVLPSAEAFGSTVFSGICLSRPMDSTFKITLGASAPTIPDSTNTFDSAYKVSTVELHIPAGAAGYDDTWQTIFKRRAYLPAVTLTVVTD
jgi:hypothetical protein